MDIADNTEFRNRLVALAELFEAKLSPQRQALYFEALRDLPFADVARGLNAAAKGCTFMPKPAEIRTLAVGSTEDAAEQAWMAFRLAMRQAGSYASLAVADAALGEAIVAIFGGWPDACAAELSPEMWASKRKEFGRVYAVLRDRHLTGPRYLPGIHERQNAGKLEWRRFVPVALLERGVVRTLQGAEADAYRTTLAAAAHGFAQLDACGDHLLPARKGETA